MSVEGIIDTFFSIMAGPDWRSKLHSVAAKHSACYKSGDFSRVDDIDAGDRSSRSSRSALSATVEDDEKLREIGSEMISGHESVTGDVKDLADDLRDNRVDSSTAAERMQKKRKEALEAVGRIVHDGFDKAARHIESLPEDQQSGAADLYLLISDGFMKFWEMAWGAILEIVKAVVGWDAGLWEEVEDFWERVRNAFEAAWAWFRSLS